LGTTFAPLYTKGKTGEIRRWQVSAEGDKVVIYHGVLGGASVRAERRATPKNVGRANATTGEQQAILEAQSAYTHKIERKYSLTPEEAEDIVPLPMLAKDYKKAKNTQFPVDEQRKLDGVRAIARWEGDKVVLISRGGKVWERVPHINKELEKWLPHGSEFDGEIYLHGLTLQQITQRVKNLKHPDNKKLQYHVYDMPTVDGDDGLAWKNRSNALDAALDDLTVGNIIQNVETFTVFNADDVIKLHDHFVAEGYEGAIIRLLNGVYEYGHRSGSLLKLKAFEDTEFVIVGHTDGEGIEEGLVKWICKNDRDAQTFETRPRGTHEDRRWLFQNATKFYGRKLTVVHFGRTDGGLPKFPIGKVIRADEDL
jgi:ATP-dependent DNA ligase